MNVRSKPILVGAAVAAGAAGLAWLASPRLRRTVRNAHTAISDELLGRTTLLARQRGVDLAGSAITYSKGTPGAQYEFGGDVAPGSALQWLVTRSPAGKLTIAYGNDIDLYLGKSPSRPLNDLEKRTLRAALAPYGATSLSQSILRALGDRRKTWPAKREWMSGEEDFTRPRPAEEDLSGLSEEERHARTKQFIDSLDIA